MMYHTNLAIYRSAPRVGVSSTWMLEHETTQLRLGRTTTGPEAPTRHLDSPNPLIHCCTSHVNLLGYIYTPAMLSMRTRYPSAMGCLNRTASAKSAMSVFRSRNPDNQSSRWKSLIFSTN